MSSVTMRKPLEGVPECINTHIHTQKNKQLRNSKMCIKTKTHTHTHTHFACIWTMHVFGRIQEKRSTD